MGDDFAEFLICYIDDLLVLSGDFREHLCHLDKVFARLLRYNFTLRLSKSKFARADLPFLGFVLSAEGVRPDPDRLNVIVNFEEPKDRVQLQRFLGVCNYYRQFNLQYAKYVHPFRDLLSQKNVGTGQSLTPPHFGQ